MPTSVVEILLLSIDLAVAINPVSAFSAVISQGCHLVSLAAIGLKQDCLLISIE